MAREAVIELADIIIIWHIHPCSCYCGL